MTAHSLITCAVNKNKKERECILNHYNFFLMEALNDSQLPAPGLTQNFRLFMPLLSFQISRIHKCCNLQYYEHTLNFSKCVYVSTRLFHLMGVTSG